MRNLLWIVAIIGVAACQPITVKEVDCPLTTTTVRMDDAAYWLEEWQRTIALPEDRLVQTLNARELEFERSANPRTRLRLALLLAEGPNLCVIRLVHWSYSRISMPVRLVTARRRWRHC